MRTRIVLPFLLSIFVLTVAPATSGTDGGGPATSFRFRDERWNVTANGTYQHHQSLDGVYCSLEATILVGPGRIETYSFNASLTLGPQCEPSLDVTHVAGHVMNAPWGHQVCATMYMVTLLGAHAAGACLDWTYACSYDLNTCYGPTAYGDAYVPYAQRDPTWRQESTYHGWGERGCRWPQPGETFPCDHVYAFHHWAASVSDATVPAAGVCPLKNPNDPPGGRQCVLWTYVTPRAHQATGSGECVLYEGKLPPSSVVRCQVTPVK